MSQKMSCLGVVPIAVSKKGEFCRKVSLENRNVVMSM